MVVESFIATFATKSRTSNGWQCWGVLFREVAATMGHINKFLELNIKYFFLGFALG